MFQIVASSFNIYYSHCSDKQYVRLQLLVFQWTLFHQNDGDLQNGKFKLEITWKGRFSSMKMFAQRNTTWELKWPRGEPTCEWIITLRRIWTSFLFPRKNSPRITILNLLIRFIYRSSYSRLTHSLNLVRGTLMAYWMGTNKKYAILT